MISGNVIGSIVHGPLALVQRLKEELSVEKLRGATSTVIASAAEKLNECASILESFRLREEQVQTDVLLSPAGKVKQMEVLTREFADKLRFIEQAATDRRQAAAELRAQLDRVPPSGSGDKVVEFLTGQEIRGELRKLSPPARMKLLSERTKAKDLGILRAIEGSPFGTSELVPAEFVARLKEDLAETNQAAEYARWRALTFVAEKLQLLANTLDTTLGKYRVDVPAFPAKTDLRTVDLGARNTQAPPDKNKAADKPTATVGV